VLIDSYSINYNENNNMKYIKVCIKLRHTKSKYLSFFSARWVSRYAGTDVSPALNIMVLNGGLGRGKRL
jgi:hypothetical protein